MGVVAAGTASAADRHTLQVVRRAGTGQAEDIQARSYREEVHTGCTVLGEEGLRTLVEETEGSPGGVHSSAGHRLDNSPVPTFSYYYAQVS